MSAHNDREFFRSFMVVLAALVAFTVFVMFAANMVFDSSGITYQSEEVVSERNRANIAPVGKVRIEGEASADVPAEAAAPKSGAEVYAASCAACHNTGAAGAPKLGDAAAWNDRVAGGVDALVAAAISGKGGMPPKGGNMSLSDDEVRAAVEHILSESGVAGSSAPVADSAGDAVMASGEQVQTASASANPDLAKGQQVYQAACFACHGTGAAGAPILGDKATWGPRIAAGADSLNRNAINGLRGMPPKGGRMDLSNDDVIAAVAYIVNQSQ
ncbi:MAG: c-type cytochrome [bacterium]